MFDRNPAIVAMMAVVLAVYIWMVVSLPLLSRLVTSLLAVAAFLGGIACIEWLQTRYGAEADE